MTTAAPENVSIDAHEVVVRGRASAADQVAIGIKDNYFEPNLLTAKPGSTVILAFQSRAAALHNVSVPSQGVDHDVPAGTPYQIKIAVPASGRIVFFCKYHRDEAGMLGAIN